MGGQHRVVPGGTGLDRNAGQGEQAVAIHQKGLGPSDPELPNHVQGLGRAPQPRPQDHSGKERSLVQGRPGPVPHLRQMDDLGDPRRAGGAHRKIGRAHV